MFRHSLIRLLALLWLLPLSALPAADAPRPNVVVIFIDDMGYADIGPFGATKQRTPQLDRMAREGMKLTSFYAAPVCSASRAQLLTGCYSPRVSVPGVYGPGANEGLNPAEITIAERLKEQGYATLCIGKWHVGDQPDFLPLRQGFDHYFGIPFSNDMQSRDTKTVPLLRDDQVIEMLADEAQSEIVRRYTEAAVEFVRSNKERPFFLYLPHNAVHTPIHPGREFAGKSSNGRFGDWVEEVDWSVGRVLDTLRELKLDERTLVVFTSDNGPWLIKGADAGSAAPLRGGKGSTWEGGVRVPTLAWWPGKIAPGSVCDAVAGTIDLLPTAVAVAGGKLPADPVIDGRSLLPVLFGQTKDSPREAHYYFQQYKLQAVRQGPWKLALAPQHESMGKPTEPDAAGDAPRLYHLGDDIGERKNVADQHPEIVTRLQALAAKMDAEIGGPHPSARRPAGRVPNPRKLSLPASAGNSSAKQGAAAAPASGKVRLFVLAGQSNMQGINPDASFTPAVRKAFPGEDVIVVRHAVGGTPIRRWWKGWKNPQGVVVEEADRAPGDLYDELVARVREALAGKKPDSVVFVWMQGERDAKTKLSGCYEAALKGLLQALRDDLQKPEMAVVIGRLNDHRKGESHWDAVRSIQEQVAAASPRGAWVDSDDLNGDNNDLHMTKDGFVTLGQRFADKALELLAQTPQSQVTRQQPTPTP